MERKRWLGVGVTAAWLAGRVLLAPVNPAAAGSTEDSTFTLRSTATFAVPALDMVQGDTPGGGSTSCPSALGDDWTCTWSSDTFIAGQAMEAGTTAVHLFPENGGGAMSVYRAAGFSSSSSARAALRSAVSNPSVNQP